MRLLISGSEVRVLHGPPIKSATSRTAEVAELLLVLLLVLLRTSLLLYERCARAVEKKEG